MTLNPAFPNGISSGDVTQNSAVVWTRAAETGSLTFQISTDPLFQNGVKTKHLSVTNPMVPVKAEFDHLKPGQQYYYRAIDASGDVINGAFATADKLGTHDGFHFGVGGDWIGELAPYVSLKNAAAADLDLFVKLGDSIYADLIAVTAPQGFGAFFPDPGGTTTLQEFQLKHDEVYSTHLNANYWADLQATTPILAMIDDHEVIDNFAGGEVPSSDPRFASQPGDFINETPLFAAGVQAFNQFNAIAEHTYSGTGNDLFDGAPDLYRYNTYGSDAAIIMVDQRTFRDAPVPGGGLIPEDPIAFTIASFTPGRTLLGEVQLDRLKQDLLDARDNGITWKFVMLPEPIQNNGPSIFPEDRYEGYAAERTELLKFIDDNHIENVVFVSSDAHWLSVNNLTYQESPFGPQIASSAIDITTMAVGTVPIAPQIPFFLFQTGQLPFAELLTYISLPNTPDPGDDLSMPANDKDDFIQRILNGAIVPFGYDPIGLSSDQATLLQGDYFVGHSYGWTDFNVDGTTGDLLVTTYGVPAYTTADLATNPGAVQALDPTIVSQFEMTPTSDSIIGTSGNDQLNGTNGADVVLGAAGNDALKGLAGNDYVDGGQGNDIVAGGNGDDHLFGRDGNDKINGGDGADRIEGGAGNDAASGEGGNDVFIATPHDGNDSYSGGAGTDTLDLSETAAPAVVSLKSGSASSADVGHDQLSSIENVIGSSGADQITGNSGANRLEGGLGNDVLTGGGGNDTFVFGANFFGPNFGSDTVTDLSFGSGPGDGIEFQGLFADFSTMLLATTDLGNDLEIAASATDTVILKNVASVASLAPDDFLFV